MLVGLDIAREAPRVEIPISSIASINALISSSSKSSVEPTLNAPSGASNGFPAYKLSTTASDTSLWIISDSKTSTIGSVPSPR